MDLVDLLIIVVKCAFMMVFLLTLLPVLIWAERKGAAYIQDRPGPNRAQVMGVRLAGMVHTVADVVKLLFKEDITPSNVYHPYYKLAPIIAMTVALLTFAVVPFAGDLEIGGRVITAQVAGLNSGLLYVLAIASLGIYGIMLAGWASNNKYALLGGVRASAQMISYEIAMGLSVAVMFLFYGTAELNKIVGPEGQTANPLLWGAFCLPGFFAFVMFTIASFAETNRLPFDLPEGESELVAGYHLEYSAFKFAMFFMAEYVNMVVASGIIVTLFFGGYQVPFLPTELLQSEMPLVAKVAFGGGAAGAVGMALWAFKSYRPGQFGDIRDKEPLVIGVGLLLGAAVLAAIGLLPDFTDSTLASIATAVIQITVFVVKILFFCWFFIWVRWTLPRFRYDQLMRLGWNYMLPLAFANLVFAGIYNLVFPDGVLKYFGIL